MANNNLKKNAKGYSYKYTDLAAVNEFLINELNTTYYQYIERIGEDDYIYTVPIVDGVEKPARRGCRVAQATLKGVSNPAQEQGSAITYARRYSLLMAFGLATTDDDAQCLSRPKESEAEKMLKAGRTEMIEAINKRYPEGSEEHSKLLAFWNVSKFEDATDEQLRAAFNRCKK